MGEAAVKIDLGYQPHQYQLEAHQGISQARFSVVVAHRRWGKTVMSINALILAALACQRDNGRFGYIAPYRGQAKSIAWDLLKTFSTDIPGIRINESELYIEYPNGSRVRLFGADNADAIRGNYFDGAVCDELADFKPDVWDAVIQPALSDRKGWCLFIGTPKGADLFYELYEQARTTPGWWTGIYRSDECSGILDPDELERLRSSMSNNNFRREYLCDFSASVDDVLIPIDMVADACGRTAIDQTGMPKILGVDPARFGGDRSVIFPRQGRLALKPIVRQDIDNMQLASLVANLIERWHPDAVFIDAGRGEGVIDRLRQLGHEVTEVNFGGKAKRPMFANKRAEMWTNMRDWIKDSGVLPNIPDLKSDLSAPTYTFDAGNRLQLERKEAMRKRGVKSPDLGDALALTFADDVWVDVDIDVADANERPTNLVTDHEEVDFA